MIFDGGDRHDDFPLKAEPIENQESDAQRLTGKWSSVSGEFSLAVRRASAVDESEELMHEEILDQADTSGLSPHQANVDITVSEPKGIDMQVASQD